MSRNPTPAGRISENALARGQDGRMPRGNNWALPREMLLSPSTALLRPLDIRHVAVADGLGHPSEANGVHNVARALVREQRAAGDQASLTLLAQDAMPPAEDATCPTRILALTGARLRGHALHVAPALVDALLDGAGPETVCHIHGGRQPMLPGLGRALRRRGIRYAVTVHGRFSHVYDPSGQLMKRSTALYLHLYERSLLNGAAFVQALSTEEAAILRRIAPKARIDIIGNGAFSSRLGTIPAPPERRAISADFPHFVYCGRYATEHKGLDLLLEGFARHVRSGGKGRLTMIGSGPTREDLQGMASSLGIADRVRILGPAFGEARDHLLRQCDFFVMASRYEGVPLAALEAGLLGLPLIMTAGTGLRAVARQAGIAVDEHSASAVAEALRQAAALSPAEWQTRAEVAHGLIRSFADWSVVAARLRVCFLR